MKLILEERIFKLVSSASGSSGIIFLDKSIVPKVKGKDNNLAKITKKFSEEEKEHLDFASEHDTGIDLFHSAFGHGLGIGSHGE